MKEGEGIPIDSEIKMSLNSILQRIENIETRTKDNFFIVPYNNRISSTSDLNEALKNRIQLMNFLKTYSNLPNIEDDEESKDN